MGLGSGGWGFIVDGGGGWWVSTIIIVPLRRAKK